MCDTPDTWPNKLEESLKTGPTYVEFQPIVQASVGKQKADVHYHMVCGEGGLLDLKGKFATTLDRGNCSSVVDYMCYGTQCKCLSGSPTTCSDESNCSSVLGRLTLPKGVSADVYEDWTCDKKVSNVTNFGGDPKTFQVGTGANFEQSLRFSLVNGYECGANGLVEKKGSMHEDSNSNSTKSDDTTKTLSQHTMYFLIGATLLGVVLAAIYFGAGSESADQPRDMTNSQILRSVGLEKSVGGEGIGKGPKGSIRDALQGGSVRLMK